MKDLYQCLGVERNASQDEIKRSFRKLTSQYHPDRNPGDSAAEERFKQVSQAYEVLGDADRRKDYDEFGEISLTQGFDRERARAYRHAAGARGAGFGPGGYSSGFPGSGFGFGDFGDARSASFDDLLSKLFGGATVNDAQSPFGRNTRQSRRRGHDITGEVNITLQEALLGTTVPLRVSAADQSARTLDVRIPAGIADGGKLRLRGQGGAGQPAGDILLTVNVQNGRYLSREGDDLRLRLPVSALEAYRGGKVDVPTPWGELSIKLPPGSQSGQTLRLREKGVRVKDKALGDLLVTLEVKLPAAGDEELLRVLERLQGQADPRSEVALLA